VDDRLDVATAEGYSRAKERTKNYWAGWDNVSTKVLATHCDVGGGILASCDTEIMQDFRDHYRYVWPRDAAMCASTLARQGLPRYARKYLEFCAKAVTPGGFFWQRYRPDATRGSGWYPPNLPDA